MKAIKYKDIQGKTFADLTAIRHLGSDKNGSALWLFQCICGNEVEYLGRSVVKGDSLSCGCRRSRNCATPKLCKHCKLPSTRKNRHGNMASVCQKCNNKQTNGFRKRNPKVQLLVNARVRSRSAKVPFDLTVDDFEIPEFCPVFGVHLRYGTTKDHNNAPSLDRIIPELGYVKGNIAVISHRANYIKNSGTVEEHRKIANWIEENAPKIELVA